MTQHRLQVFPRSFRTGPEGTRLRDVDGAAPIQLTVVLRPQTAIEPAGPVLSRVDFGRRHGTRQASVDALVAYAQSHGLRVVQADAASHRVVLAGTYAQAGSAFTPEALGVYEQDGREFIARSGQLSVPTELASEVVAVMGFDQRPVAQPHFRRRARAAAAATSYAPTAVAARYGFPAGTGAGQVIALIELGGGFEPAQMTAYFKANGVHRTGTLVAVPVDGLANTPGDPSGPDGEVQLDIEVAGSVAPAADLAVYFGPNQGSGFLDAITAAVHDTERAVSVVSISWGGPETGWAAQDMDAMDQLFQTAGGLGITVCVASGDNGASDMPASDGSSGREESGDEASKPRSHHKKAAAATLTVDFPASSPHVLGCGGTSLPKTGAEVAWNDGASGGASGGGYSTQFTRPSWQAGNSETGRGVPDVSGDADPGTGYDVSVDGEATVIGGTSAVAPLWAGLIALVNQAAGRKVGFVNPVLYAHPTALSDITSGNNNGYSCTPGWDPVTGLGSPKGAQVLAVLKGTTATS